MPLLHIYVFLFRRKKSKSKESFYGLQVKTIDISEVFSYTISKEQGGE